jgi:uncharacterized sodium:solute symporter family permease YidK
MIETNELKINTENKIIELENKILKLSKEKKKFWRVIPMVIILPIIGPYVPLRRGMLADRMGYQNSALMLIVLCIIIVPIACYWKFQKINNEIFDLEYDKKILEQKDKLKTENNK